MRIKVPDKLKITEDELFRVVADRDRWKERCEAAENIVYCCLRGCIDSCGFYQAWERIKSEMEAE